MIVLYRDFFLDKRREKEKLEADMKRMVMLKAIIPAVEAKPVAPLSVILSQFYLNLAEFCTHFNNKTSPFKMVLNYKLKLEKVFGQRI
jgi:ribosomal protein L11